MCVRGNRLGINLASIDTDCTIGVKRVAVRVRVRCKCSQLVASAWGRQVLSGKICHHRVYGIKRQISTAVLVADYCCLVQQHILGAMPDNTQCFIAFLAGVGSATGLMLLLQQRKQELKEENVTSTPGTKMVQVCAHYCLLLTS